MFLVFFEEVWGLLVIAVLPLGVQVVGEVDILLGVYVNGAELAVDGVGLLELVEMAGVDLEHGVHVEVGVDFHVVDLVVELLGVLVDLALDFVLDVLGPGLPDGVLEVALEDVGDADLAALDLLAHLLVLDGEVLGGRPLEELLVLALLLQRLDLLRHRLQLVLKGAHQVAEHLRLLDALAAELVLVVLFPELAMNNSKRTSSFDTVWMPAEITFFRSVFLLSICLYRLDDSIRRCVFSTSGSMCRLLTGCIVCVIVLFVEFCPIRLVSSFDL